MGDNIFAALGVSLGLTLVLELSLCALLGYRSSRAMLITVLANVLTNPPVVLCYSLFVGNGVLGAVPATVILETAAVLVEGLCYKYRVPEVRKPFLLSLLLNGFSYFTGLILQHLYFGV